MILGISFLHSVISFAIYSIVTSSHVSKNFLKVLVNPENPDIDIVAVHGLNPTNAEFHAEATWTAGDKLWLKDFLPSQLPNARILLFGYNSNVAFETSIAGVREQAVNLLNRLASKREDAEKRQIIFVAHSLGGIIVKRALVEAKLDDTYKAIRDDTYGIAFFGTPHQGGNFAKLGDIAASIVKGVLRNPKNTFMEALKKDSLFSDTLVDDFRHQLEDYYVLSFYETLQMGKLGLIVDKKSATLGLAGVRERQIPMEANHNGICKFASAEGDDYEQVSFNLVRLVKSALRAVAEKERVRPSSNPRPEPAFILPYTQNPNFVGRRDIFERLQKELVITGEHQPQAVLWGLGGVGKSQIAIQYAYWHRKTYPEHSVFWLHGSSFDRFHQDFSEIARERRVPGFENPKADYLALMKAWLSSERSGKWLMVIDNADDSDIFFGEDTTIADSGAVEAIPLRKYIPDCSHGAILVTTRNKIVGQRLTRGRSLIKVSPMNETESVELFRKQLKGEILETNTLEELTRELEGLPLALAQAAAFIQMNSFPLHDYLRLYKENDEMKMMLLSKPFEALGRDTEAPNPVAATWIISFKHIKHTSPHAAHILSLMALLDRQGIPESLIRGESANRIELVEALGTLKAFSLIYCNEAGDTFGMHRLVHLATRNWLSLSGEFDSWAISCLKMMSKEFPSGEHGTLDTCDLYLPHAMAALSYKQLSSANDIYRAPLAYRMSRYLLNRGKYNVASTLAEQVLGLYERILGKEHPDTLSSLNNFAQVLNHLGKYNEAEEMHRRTLELKVKVLGAEDPDTLASMNNLAQVLNSQGKYEEAEEMNRRALELCERVLGIEHPFTLVSMSILAQVLDSQGKYKEAEEINRRTVELSKSVLGAEDPDTLAGMSNLARVLGSQGKYKEAEEMHRRTLELKERVLGIEHPFTLVSMSNLAGVLDSQGKYKEAEEMHRRALELRERVLGTEHPNTLNSYHWLAYLLQRRKRYSDSSLLYQKALLGYQKELGLDHPTTLACSEHYSSLLDEMSIERFQVRNVLCGRQNSVFVKTGTRDWVEYPYRRCIPQCAATHTAL